MPKRGYKQSDEHRRKNKQSHLGQIAWNKGKHEIYSKETLNKMSKWQIGRKQSKETKEKRANKLRGRKRTQKVKKILSEQKMGDKNPNFGKTHTEEYKKYMSELMSGENSPSWQGGLSFQIYPKEFKKIKKEIRIRDNNICQLCDAISNNKKEFDVHHIDYNKKNNNHMNLITLCRSCNAHVNKNRNYWTEYFTKVLNSSEDIQEE